MQTRRSLFKTLIAAIGASFIPEVDDRKVIHATEFWVDEEKGCDRSGHGTKARPWKSLDRFKAIVNCNINLVGKSGFHSPAGCVIYGCVIHGVDTIHFSPGPFRINREQKPVIWSGYERMDCGANSALPDTRMETD